MVSSVTILGIIGVLIWYELHRIADKLEHMNKGISVVSIKNLEDAAVYLGRALEESAIRVATAQKKLQSS